MPVQKLGSNWSGDGPENTPRQQHQDEQLERRRSLNREAQKWFRARKREARRRSAEQEQQPAAGWHSDTTYLNLPTPASPPWAGPAASFTVDRSLTANPTCPLAGEGISGASFFELMQNPPNVSPPTESPVQYGDPGLNQRHCQPPAPADALPSLTPLTIAAWHSPPPVLQHSSGSTTVGSASSITTLSSSSMRDPSPVTAVGEPQQKTQQQHGPHATEDGLREALFLAARNGHTGVIRVLAESDANLDALSADRNTALHLAILGRHTDTVSLLLNQNVERHTPNIDNLTPLTLAARIGFEEGVRLLLGAD